MYSDHESDVGVTASDSGLSGDESNTNTTLESYDSADDDDQEDDISSSSEGGEGDDFYGLDAWEINPNQIFEVADNVLKYQNEAEAKRKQCELEAVERRNKDHPTFAELYKISMDDRFRNAVFVCVVFSTAIIATQHAGMNDRWSIVLTVSDCVFTFIFAVELLINLLGIGWQAFRSDPFMVFDLITTLASVGDIFITRILRMDTIVGIAVLRLVRISRIFKLSKKFIKLQIILSTLMSCILSVANFMVLLLLFIYTYSILGMWYVFNVRVYVCMRVCKYVCNCAGI